MLLGLVLESLLLLVLVLGLLFLLACWHNHPSVNETLCLLMILIKR